MDDTNFALAVEAICKLPESNKLEAFYKAHQLRALRTRLSAIIKTLEETNTDQIIPKATSATPSKTA